jgi:transposase
MSDTLAVVDNTKGRSPMRALMGFLRFVLRVQGFIVEGVEVLREEDAVVIRGRRHANAVARCQVHRDEVLGGAIKRRAVRWRHLDMFRTRVFLECEIREGRCRRCNGRRLERVPWATPQARHTRVFDQRVSSLVQVADKSAAKRMFALAWRTVGRIVTRVVRECIPRDLLDDLRAICVDETSYKRGHRYITVVTDLERNRVVWVGEGKSAETLAKFFAELGPERARKLVLVAMDMSEAYRGTVKECAPQAEIVYDRFHVVKLLLEAVDEVRREECRKLAGEERKALKHTRFALLRNPAHLKPKDLEAIARVRATNRRLTRAYQLRVDLEELWKLTDKEAARSFLRKWTRAALLSRLEPFRRLAMTIRKHIAGILNFFHFLGQTSGMAEGMNNKIKLVIHRAFGFHKVAALMAMIQLCCTGIHFE